MDPKPPQTDWTKVAEEAIAAGGEWVRLNHVVWSNTAFNINSRRMAPFNAVEGFEAKMQDIGAVAKGKGTLFIRYIGQELGNGTANTTS